MFYTIFDQKMLIVLSGVINTTNSNELNDEIESVRTNNAHHSLTIDIKDVSYISSSGLRIMLRLAKEEKEFEIINVSKDIYDIFEMTGFTNMIKISRAFRKISTKGCELIGDGYSSEVYRIDKDTIVKKIIIDTTLDDIKRELNISKHAFLLGVPTAISYDVVDVDGRYGMVYEMLDCDSLRDAINKNPEKVEDFAKEYVKLIRNINSKETDSETIPSCRQRTLDNIEKLKGSISNEHYEKIKKLYTDLGESNHFIHGDCHVKNIMTNANELLLIDMDTLSKGKPIFELGAMCGTYIGFGICYQEGNAEYFLKMKTSLVHDLFYKTMHYYFEGSKSSFEDNMNKVFLACYTHMMIWKVNNENDNQPFFDKTYNEFKKYIDLVDTLELD